MLKHRLTLGPILIIAITFFAYLDDFLDRLATPAWIPYSQDTLPPGLV
ncbi:MAG: hypothetical protein JKY96_05465, partial [Phycisphaerales bacterium]|nr:hypothetical protein [Phycisphaerales bacterium]